MRIAIISPNRNVYSETFITAHIQHLKGEKLVLTDGHLPKRDSDGNLLLKLGALHSLQRRLGRISTDDALRSAVRDKIKGHATQVILAEYGPTGAAILPLAKELKIPLVVHFHGIDAFHDSILAEHAKSYGHMFSYASAVIAVSREMERQLLDLGCPREKLHYNCYGIDTDQFGSASPASAEKKFMAVGRFVDKKAPHLTILAFQRAWLQDPEIKMMMAGNGPLWDACVQLVQALGLNKAVELPGVMPHDDVAKHLGDCRAFVQHSVVSSKNDHEGTPLAVLEAMARGLPVIATRHAGIPDVVLESVNGLLCDELDIVAMAANMLQLAQDPALAARYGAAGRERVMAHHTMAQSITALQHVLQTAAS